MNMSMNKSTNLDCIQEDHRPIFQGILQGIMVIDTTNKRKTTENLK
jgi:hypothetical protein